MAGILQIAMNDRTTGRGAGALLVHRALLRAGKPSELWVFEQTTAEPGVHSLTDEETGAQPKIVREQELTRILQGRSITDFERIYIHGLGHSIPPALLSVLTKTKVCWLLDDCAPYTAGCSHSAHCTNWRLDSHKDCVDCPACTGNAEQQKKQVETYRLKHKIYRSLPKHSLTFLCQNTWQQEQLKHSIASSVDSIVCPRLLDMASFHPGSREKARRSLGLPERAFVLLMPTDLTEGRERVLRYVQNVLRQLRRLYTGYIVLVGLGRETLASEWPVDELRSVDLGAEPSLIAAYYRAANLQLWLAGIDSSYVQVREAGLCGLPSVVFAMGASKVVLAAGSGFVIEPFAEGALTKVLLSAMRDDSPLLEVGMKLYTRLKAERSWQEQGLALSAGKEYAVLYTAGSEQIRFFLQHELARRWSEAETDTQEQKNEKRTRRATFIDQFCRGWLRTVPLTDDEAIWRFVEVWLNCRTQENLGQFGTTESLLEHVNLCRELRAALIRYFQYLPMERFASLPQRYIDVGIKLWNSIFLNVESALVRTPENFDCPPDLLRTEGIYPKYLIWSMFVPYVPQKIDLQMRTLVTNDDLPVMLRVILSLWLISAPFFGGTPDERRTILNYIGETCHFLMDHPDFVAVNLRDLMMEKLMVSLWRISYLGGNNIEALRAYGDYLQSLARRQYPEFMEPLLPRKREPGEPLRIGYVSLNFRRQAVSQYMANRLKYHDRKSFFVKTFILEKSPSDEMTEKIREWSDESVTLPVKNFSVIPETAKAIRESNLDLVIYGDIGMDNITYQLGALQLAPVQAVLVGHGTTTGLSSIDYYISGDHEPANAQEHYVEQLIRLPNAGAAQLPPAHSDRVLSRSDYGIPEDAVVFISCANGLKHIPERDALLAGILQQAPNAYILLKPYMSRNLVDAKFTNRLLAAAERVGAADRMKIAPPLPQAGDLMSFLQLGDVQLDTYPYGGWTTNLEALYYHLPIVTQQGDIARSRWGAGLLQAMGIEEGIAHDAQGYVDWAVRFAREPELRERVSARIAEMAPQVLFNGEAAQPSYEQALRQMIEEKEKKARKAKKVTNHKNKKHS